MNLRIGLLGRFLNSLLVSKYGWCFRCLTPWNYVEHHSTYYREGRGCFPLCEKCWAQLIPETREQYYWQLWLSWFSTRGLATTNDDFYDLAQDWPMIQRAVRRGL